MPTTRIALALGLLAIALALPRAAGAEPVLVAPPSADRSSAGVYETAAKRSGCRSRNVIDFQGLLLAFRVRHFGGIRCNVPTRVRCEAVLSDADGRISRLRDRGRKRCSMGSRYARSDRYATGAGIAERFRYKLKLLRPRERWSATTEFCPRRSRNHRTLICRDTHATNAPLRSSVRH